MLAGDAPNTMLDYGETANAVRTPSALDDVALFETLTNWFFLNRDHSREWRAQTKSNFKFAAGDQWSEGDRKALEDQRRPVITFNRVLPMLKSVAGIEVNSRHETVFLPRCVEEGEQVAANEVLSATSKWMDDSCDAEDEQSEAFWDALVCGMGWTEQRMSYDDDAEGLYAEDRIYPIEMYWDYEARKKNLSDAKHLFRLRKRTLAQARELIEGLGVKNVDDSHLDAAWAVEGDANTNRPRPVEELRDRRDGTAEFDPRSTVHLVHAQWIETQAYYKMVDPNTRGLIDVDAGRHDAIQALAKRSGAGKLKSVRMMRKVYKEAFLGSRVLLVKNTASRAGFTFHCITGDRNSEKGTWFGIVDSMRDPQMWANKWLSQTLHIMNTTAKGGILAEENAFPDMRKAQETYARPDAITVVSDGAIAKGKIKEKPGAGMPAGHMELTQFAIGAIRDTTGINMELIGARETEQPGIVENMRKQAAMTILATTFDSLRRFRKLVGRTKLCFIQDYIGDGRLIRIKGADGVMRGKRILRERTAGEYEVVVDDAPTSPTQKEQIWGAFQMLLPVIQPFMEQNPEVAMTVLEYSPLPSQVVQKFRELGQKSAQSPQAKIQQETARLALEDKAANIEKTHAQAAHAAAQAEKLHSDAALYILESAGALPGKRPALTGPASGPAGGPV